MAIAGGAWPVRYEEVDPPCHTIVRALNTLEGIRTVECCCGHGERHYWVCFLADSKESLVPILQAVHELFPTTWKVQVELAPPGRPRDLVWYRLLCSKLLGPEAYCQATEIAMHLLER